MVVETILGFLVGAAVAWLFIYSAALIGAKHTLRDHFQESSSDEPATSDEIKSPERILPDEHRIGHFSEYVMRNSDISLL